MEDCKSWAEGQVMFWQCVREKLRLQEVPSIFGEPEDNADGKEQGGQRSM